MRATLRSQGHQQKIYGDIQGQKLIRRAHDETHEQVLPRHFLHNYISFYLVVTKRCEEVRFGTGLASRENSYC